MFREAVVSDMTNDPGYNMFTVGVTFNLPFQRERRQAMLAESSSETTMSMEELNGLKNNISYTINDTLAQMERGAVLQQQAPIIFLQVPLGGFQLLQPRVPLPAGVGRVDDRESRHQHQRQHTGVEPEQLSPGICRRHCRRARQHNQLVSHPTSRQFN
jgi:hypothetical protein